MVCVHVYECAHTCVHLCERTHPRLCVEGRGQVSTVTHLIY